MKIHFGMRMTVIVAMLIFIASMAGYIAGAHSKKNEEEQNVTATEASEERTSPWKISAEKNMPPADAKSNVTEGYILRENNGGLSLYVSYRDGGEELYQNYETRVSALPESDRKLLEEGIFVNSLSEALSLAEDYSS